MTAADDRAASAAPNEIAVHMNARDLADALDQVLPTAGINPHLPHLMCVLLEAKDESIRLVTTDSHRLTIRDVMPLSSTSEFTSVLAAATVRSWPEALRSNGQQASTVTLDADANLVRIVGDGIDLSARPIPSTFPDYESVLRPAEELSQVVVDRDDMLGAFDTFDNARGDLGGNERDFPTSPDGAVLMSTTSSGLTLQRRSTRVDVAGTTSSPDVHVVVDPKYAATAIRHAVGSDIVIGIDDPIQPVVFRSVDDGTYTSRVMPVKLD